MRALEELNQPLGKKLKFYHVYTFVDKEGKPSSEKQYVRVAYAERPMTFSTETAWAAIEALKSVGIKPYAEEIESKWGD